MTLVAFWWLIKMIFSVEQYNANMKNLINFFGIFSFSFLKVKMLTSGSLRFLMLIKYNANMKNLNNFFDIF
jgi:hypothetical protein